MDAYEKALAQTEDNAHLWFVKVRSLSDWRERQRSILTKFYLDHMLELLQQQESSLVKTERLGCEGTE